MKLQVEGKDMLARVRINTIVANTGIEAVIPLQYLIALVWCLSYKTVTPINNPELVNPWAIIKNKEATIVDMQKGLELILSILVK